MDKKISTLEELWCMERIWEGAENTNKADQGLWLIEGVGIYSMLLQRRPEDKFYKDSIERITKQIEFYIIKRSKEWEKIQKVCEEFYRIKSNNVYILYYLGYCAFKEQKWQVSSQYLTKSMTLPGLDQSHIIKALCGLAICMEKLGNYTKSIELLDQARVDCSPEMMFEVEMVCTQIECMIQAERPYQSIMLGKAGQQTSSKFVTSEEAREIISNNIDELLLLDMRHPHNYQIIGPRNTVRLQPMQALLLKYLLLNSEAKTRSEIKKALWNNSKNPHLVKKYISELRSLIKNCLDTDFNIIENIRNKGYRCILGLPVIIISSKNPEGNL